MILKNLKCSNTLNYLQNANNRCTLNETDEHQLLTSMKGIEGERLFLNCFEHCENILKLWDLQIDYRGLVQFDILFIVQGVVYHFEIKNYNGLFVEQGDNLQGPSGFIYRGIYSQLDRQHMMLKNVCQGFKVVSKIVMINPGFKINTNRSDIIFHSDLDELVRKFAQVESFTAMDLKLARKLEAMHIQDSKFDRIFYYPFNELKKGLKCPNCRKILEHPVKTKKKIICSCGHMINKREAIMLSIDEIECLKNDYFTCSEVSEWAGVSANMVYRILRNEDAYDRIGHFKDARYRKKRHQSKSEIL